MGKPAQNDELDKIFDSIMAATVHIPLVDDNGIKWGEQDYVGVTEESLSGAKHAITEYVTRARLGELKRLREHWGSSYDETLGGRFNFVSLYDFDKRIAELEAKLEKKQ